MLPGPAQLLVWVPTKSKLWMFAALSEVWRLARQHFDTMEAPRGITLTVPDAAEVRLRSPKRARELRFTMMGSEVACLVLDGQNEA